MYDCDIIRTPGEHVAGAAALFAATHPGASPAEIQEALSANGLFDWHDGDDPDGEKEPLLNERL